MSNFWVNYNIFLNYKKIKDKEKKDFTGFLLWPINEDGNKHFARGKPVGYWQGWPRSWTLDYREQILAPASGLVGDSVADSDL